MLMDENGEPTLLDARSIDLENPNNIIIDGSIL